MGNLWNCIILDTKVKDGKKVCSIKNKEGNITYFDDIPEESLDDVVKDIEAKAKKKGKTANEYLDDLVKPKTRKPTQIDIEELAKIRSKLNAGKSKNVAFTKGEIGGEKINLYSRSGEPKGTPKNYDNFEQIKFGNYHYKDGPLNRIYDSEQKQFEYLYNRYKHNKSVKGKIEIVSDLEFCRNCDYIINQFKKDFPNIEIVKVWVKESL